MHGRDELYLIVCGAKNSIKSGVNGVLPNFKLTEI